MKDIVERIRGLRFVHVPIASGLMEEAAVEIDRLREAILRLADQDATLSVQGGSVTLDATLIDHAAIGRVYADNLLGEPAVSRCLHAMADEIERLRGCHLESADRSSIVDQLRDRAYCGKGVDSLCERAASEIERLMWAEKTSKNVIDRLMKTIPSPAKKGFEKMTFAQLEDAVKQWARDRKIIPNSNPKMQLLKTVSELGELADATAKGDAEGIVDGIGDVLVTLIIYAELSGLTLTECLYEAFLTIKDRRGTLTSDGIFVKEVG